MGDLELEVKKFLESTTGFHSPLMIQLIVDFTTRTTKKLERKIHNQQKELRRMNREKKKLLKIIHGKDLEKRRLIRRKKELQERLRKRGEYEEM